MIKASNAISTSSPISILEAAASNVPPPTCVREPTAMRAEARSRTSVASILLSEPNEREQPSGSRAERVAEFSLVSEPITTRPGSKRGQLTTGSGALPTTIRFRKLRMLMRPKQAATYAKFGRSAKPDIAPAREPGKWFQMLHHASRRLRENQIVRSWSHRQRVRRRGHLTMLDRHDAYHCRRNLHSKRANAVDATQDPEL